MRDKSHGPVSGFLALLRGAKKLEWLILVAAAAFLLLLTMNRGGGNSGTELEKRLVHVLSSVEGAGEVRVMARESGGEVTGVLVVAEGAGDARVVFAITNALHTLLGIDTDQIEVQKMDSG